MTGGVKVRDYDHGYRAVLKAVYGLAKNRPSVVVGILAANAGREQDGVTVLDKAIWNEFGTMRNGKPHVPARSFIRATFDMHRAEAIKRLTALLRQVVAGKLTEKVALERFGLWFQGLIQKRIAAGIPPENAASTVKRKGSSKPLIDTGQLRSSVSYAVRRR